jgi:Lon-like protease
VNRGLLFRLFGGVAVLLVIALAVLWFAPSSDYLLLPDTAQPVAPLISVGGRHKPDRDKGQIYFLAVLVRKASLFEDMFPGIHQGATLVPASELQPPGVSESAQHAIDAKEMVRSQDVAGGVALKAAGFPVRIRETGARIAAVFPGYPAEKLLRETDVIVSVNGKAIHGPGGLRAVMSKVKPRASVRLGIRGATGLRTVVVKTVPFPHHPSRSFMGIEVDQAGSVKLPFPVRISPGAVVGPSAGLAFALEIMEKLGRNVDHGMRIAATGELELNGAVLPIGGVEQKTIEARRAKADVLLIPAGDNAAAARKYAGDMKVVAVDSFQQALRKLATVAKNR